MPVEKYFVLIIIILTPNICLSDKNIDECTLNLVWGHGSTKFYDSIREKKYKGKSIAMACSTKNIGDIDTQIYQGSGNGDWMVFLHPGNNGGLNPILSKENLEIITNNYDFSICGYPKVTVDKTTQNAEGCKSDFHYREMNIIWDKQREIENYPINKKTLNSIGFARLVHYNWAALIKEGGKLLENKECSKVKLNFICPDKNGHKHGALNTKKLRERINTASLKNLSREQKLRYTDARGYSLFYEQRECIPNKINTTPNHCDESIELDLDEFIKYKKSTCGNFLKKVSKKYNTKKLLDRYRLFDDYAVKEAVELPVDRVIYLPNGITFGPTCEI